MIGRTIRHAIVSRRTTLALLTGAFLPRPPAVRAQASGTCVPPGPGANEYFIEIVPSGGGQVVTGRRPGLTGRLRLHIDAEGHAQMDGAILVVSAVDGPMPIGDPPRRLVAKGAAAQASCADADGDDIEGVVQVATNFRDTAEGELFPVVLETLTGQDIDERGTYTLNLSIGDERWTVDARVTLGPTRRRQRRRRR